MTSDIPKVCSICKRRKPGYIIRPCNHVILCKTCQKIRLNQFTNCWTCFKPVDFLWAFRPIKRDRFLQVYKVIEVRKSLQSTTYSNEE
jgi:molybdenum cofactor biosynthesis enzyme MoaA